MTHLSNDQLLDALESGAATHPHLDVCSTCRTRVDELRQVLSLTRAVEVPEPSPLFWDHFSERVRAAVATESHDSASVRFAHGWLPSLAGALAVIIIGFAVTMRSGQPTVRGTTQDRLGAASAAHVRNGGTTNLQDASSGATSSPEALPEDPTWAFMGDLTSQIDWDHVEEAGLVATPGAAERVLQDMTSEEQRIVLELLQQEMQNVKQL